MSLIDLMQIFEQGALAVGYLLMALGALKAIAKLTKTSVDDKILDAMIKPLSLLSGFLSAFRRKEDK